MAGKAKEEEFDNDIVITDAPETVVDAGEVDSSAEADEEKVVQRKTPVRKRGNDTQKRMNEIWMKSKQAEEEANRQSQIAAQERAKNVEYEQITASALEENLNTKRELLKERLVRAQEAQDPKAIADIQVELGKVEAQSAQIDRYKIENRVQPQRKEAVQQREVVADPDELYERMSPAGKKWLDENSDWYDNGGDNHDPEKAGDVKYYAQTLEQELINAGRGAEIGTRGYFNKINDYIKQNWSDDMQEQDDPIPQKRNYAAPVGNRNVSGPSSGTRKEYTISRIEKEMALSLDMKDKMGNPLSDNDKIKRFVSLRESVPSSGPISMKTMNKGA